MTGTKIILIACGSFNPPTNMHLRMFEIARDYLHRMGTHEVIGGIISPTHNGYAKKDLANSTDRLAMVNLALRTSDWIKLSSWECRQETWSRTRQVLNYHQNVINSILQSQKNNCDTITEEDYSWIPENIKNGCGGVVQLKLLCGADLLESFGTPNLWSDEDIEAIVGQHGLVVITRSNANPLEFIYNSDTLTKYMPNISIVTEWITNEVSSTKIRRALRRMESVKYLIPDHVLDYIYKHKLYGAIAPKYLTPNEFLNSNSILLTPSPNDTVMESSGPINCMYICNNNLFNNKTNYEERLSLDTLDSVTKSNAMNVVRHPGQAVKIVTEPPRDHYIIKDIRKDSMKEATLV